ncbi:4109_t:CDS:2 [Ambispora leptoticha]|uniref:4109_t:CDS:1 n=1 Tax=Ambispora leptoticha TaxID=144679 RepID=A0A9N8Z1W7_9GLOM|nr:4109_t:CDS:2 [Ambispora leptoticha]
MDNQNQQLKSGNNSSLQFNVEEIDEDLRKRVIATLHANIVKTTPNEDKATCFARAKTLEDTIYKIAKSKAEYQNLLVNKLMEMNPQYAMQQQQNATGPSCCSTTTITA